MDTIHAHSRLAKCCIHQPSTKGRMSTTDSFCRMMKNADQKSRPAPRSISGNTAGMVSAQTNDDSTTKAVIVLMFPPIFAVTTGAAVAAGPMIHVSRASQRSLWVLGDRCWVMGVGVWVSSQRMTATTSATSTSCVAMMPMCHRCGRIWWKSMRQNVENSVENTIHGNTASTTSPSLSPTASNCGTQQNSR